MDESSASLIEMLGGGGISFCSTTSSFFLPFFLVAQPKN